MYSSYISAVILSVVVAVVFYLGAVFFPQVMLFVICAGLIGMVFATAFSIEKKKEKDNAKE